MRIVIQRVRNAEVAVPDRNYKVGIGQGLLVLAAFIDEDTLEDVLDYAYVNMDSFSLNFSWEEVYSRYQQEEMKE